jgi:hypothetical protein
MQEICQAWLERLNANAKAATVLVAVGYKLQVDQVNTLTLGVLERRKLVTSFRPPASGQSSQHSYPWCSGEGEAGAQFAVGHQLQVDQVNTLTLSVLERGKASAQLDVGHLDVGHQLQADKVNTLTLGVLERGKLVPSLL